MTTTLANYLTIANNLPRAQTAAAASPAVKNASAYYAANIGKVTSIAQFVGNYRLLSYALDAYGLGDQINSKGLITKVLQGGVSNPKSLANTLPQWTAFAKAFNFLANGAASISTPTAIAATKSAYVEQQLETNAGKQDNVGVQLALYFNRVAPTVTTEYGILADRNLLQVVETIFGLPAAFGSESVDTQAKELTKLLPLSDLSNPTKLKQLTDRFAAEYDSTYGPGSTSSAAPLTVSGSSSSSSTSTVSPAVTILSAVVASGSSGGTLFSTSLLDSLQGLRFGG